MEDGNEEEEAEKAKIGEPTCADLQGSSSRNPNVLPQQISQSEEQPDQTESPKAKRMRVWLGKDINSMGLSELHEAEQQLRQGLRRIKEREEQIQKQQQESVMQDGSRESVSGERKRPTLEMVIENLRNKLNEDRRAYEDDHNPVLPSEIPMASLAIGYWQRVFPEADLTAKVDYVEKKLIWDITNLRGEAMKKNKIEISWSDISAIKVTEEEDMTFAKFEIELLRQPLFFGQPNNLHPRDHPWERVADFTAGEASTLRRHVVKFNGDDLEQHIGRLSRSDLFELIRKPFPSLESIYFDYDPV